MAPSYGLASEILTCMWKYNVVTIRPSENATSFTGSGVMPLTDKSRYFRLALANYERADAVENPKLKAKFMEIAARYRDLALEIDDAESRPGAVIAPKHK